MTLPIFVISQIKNEERSLPRFLRTCETFADRIILFDQGSTDQSAAISKQFQKVQVFPNLDKHLQETRSIYHMYEIARAQEKGPKIILRLDADEVLSANATSIPEWETLRNAAPGTVICFPRVEMLGFDECYVQSIIDRGYVDDNRVFSVMPIHAVSTPIKYGCPTLTCHKINLLHYSGLRKSLGEAKMRYYCMLENLYCTRPIFERRIMYRQGKILDVIRSTGRRVQFNDNWISAYEAAGIDMTSIADDPYPWHDEACIDLMLEHGVERFHMDPIWYHDWEFVIQLLPERKKQAAEAAFRRPSPLSRKITALAERMYLHPRLPVKPATKRLINSRFEYSIYPLD